jgi:ElaB/YqjD/DUF883 family membrane-anchored ribosome-binding protein
VFQYAHAANLRKRSIIDDVKQKVQEAVDQAESKFNEVSENISALISSTLQDVQTKAAEVIGEIQSAVATAQQIGRNIEPCVSGQEAATRRVVDETGMSGDRFLIYLRVTVFISVRKADSFIGLC